MSDEKMDGLEQDAQPQDSAAEEPAAKEASPQEGAPVPATEGLSVNRSSSRLELENAGLALNVDEAKLKAVSDHEELWKLVKNAWINKNTVVNVEEDVEAGDLMKVTVKHNGQFYKKGNHYELDGELREEFRNNFFI